MPDHCSSSGPPSSGGHIVVAEDDRFYRQILAKRLKAAGHRVTLTSNGQEAWEAIQADAPELLLTDWMMPLLDGYELCRKVKDEPSCKAVYCILLTAKGGVQDKIAALDVGADDYLIKPCDDGELLARVRTGLRVHRLCARLEEVSITDPLTGLRNRRYLDQRLDEEISRCRRYRTPLSLVLVDLDHFKEVNDRYGHPVGDEILSAVGTVLAERTRLGEVAARIGGDEFAVLLPNTSLEGARAFARNIENALPEVRGRLDVSEEMDLEVAGSAGAAQLMEGKGASDLVKAADDALYVRKQERRAARAGSS